MTGGARADGVQAVSMSDGSGQNPPLADCPLCDGTGEIAECPACGGKGQVPVNEVTGINAMTGAAPELRGGIGMSLMPAADEGR